MNKKPFIYIASPYTLGDPGINSHYSCKVFDDLMNVGRIWPVAPLWSHLQHLICPRPYKDWLEYDRAMIPLLDGCLRIDIDMPKLNYFQSESAGADEEVALFKELGKPVFHDTNDMYRWVDSLQ